MPRSLSASAMVSGMRSPASSSTIRMMNWPAFRSLAIRGASIVIPKTVSDNCFFSRILFIKYIFYHIAALQCDAILNLTPGNIYR